jgi:Carboxypeptidase regulatory-like domain
MRDIMTKLLRFALVALLAASSTAAFAQTLSGTVSGQVVDAQGGVLPGVTVVLTGRTGSIDQTTDETGTYRFIGLQPGTFSIRAELAGFKPFEQQNIVVGIGSTIQVRIPLDVGGLQESIQVTAAMLVDTTSTATDNVIDQALLFQMPLSRTNAAVSLLNYSPGVNNGAAFGGAAGASNALLLDGVDTRDPEGGGAWTFFNYNIVEAVEVGGLGAPAEFGGFQGAVVNSITKSGGNAFSSLFEYRYTGKDLRGDNLTSEIKRENPSLRASGVDRLDDYTVQLGGPLKRDKAFFFGSIQRYSIKEDPAGPRTSRTEVSPRFNVKFTFQPTQNDNLTANFQYDQYNQTGRTGLGGVDGTTDRRTVEQDSPEWIWNGAYRKVLGNSSFFETKFTGYWGYFDLDPIDSSPARLNDDGGYSGGGGFVAKYDRLRNQLNASFTRYVEAGGTHNFKFGVEIERSTIRNRYAYSGDIYYYDLGGLPYIAYSYAYDVEGTNKRQSVYAQDQWTIGRVTANIGFRFDGIGGVGSDDTTIYDTKQIAPRLGLTWDVTGRGTSVLKGYYGQLYEGAMFQTWNRAVSGIGDRITYDVSPTGRLTEIDRVSGASKYTVADDIKHPRTDEFNLAYEQQIGTNWRATGTYIHREAKNLVNSVLIGGRWAPSAFTNPRTNQPMTIYTWANRNAIPQRFEITNIDSVDFPGAGTFEGYRDYNAGMFVLERRFVNRWQARASYVYSKTNGTVINNGTAGFASALTETPNTSLINRDGRVPLDRPHEFKLFGGYQIPKVEVSFNAYYRHVSGQAYTPFFRVAAGRVNWTASNDVQLETQGENRIKAQNIVDLRLEKVFSFDVHRFGIYADIENAFNASAILTRQARFPSASIGGNPVAFGNVATVTPSRQITIGARWSF